MVKSHWGIDEAVVGAIRLLAKKGSTIVKLGSGTGTKILSSGYTVYSVEDNEEWVGHCEKANYIHAPLVEFESNSRLIFRISRKGLSETPSDLMEEYNGNSDSLTLYTYN